MLTHKPYSTTLRHSPLLKACSIADLGRSSVIEVGIGGDSVQFDFEKLGASLGRPNTAPIVVVSCGEVNTGQSATNNREHMRQLRLLCDKYGAWLHIDGGKFRNLRAV